MNKALLFFLALGFVSPVFAQYSAGQLTRKVVPPRQQPSASRAPGGSTATVRPAAPANSVRIKAEQSKTEKNLVEYHKKRAEAGSDRAQYELGIRYLAGKGVDKDEKLARKWLQKSAKAGNEQAIGKLKELKWPLADPEESAVGKAAALPAPKAQAE